jgi:Ser/Thr protein kinase RdoA (MazF antagonist)
VKSWEGLTRQGRLRRLRQVAVQALDAYNLDVHRLELVSHHLNILYRVVSESGDTHALRISATGWRSELELRSEIQWLLALDRDMDIDPHVPLMNRAGEYVTTIADERVPEPRHCVLFTWIPGVEVGTRLTQVNVEKMGILSAQLHLHGLDFTPQHTFTTRRLDSLFPRDETVVLFDPEHQHLFSPEQLASFKGAWTAAEAELERLYAHPEGLRVVHGDLHHENIKIHQGKLHPIDFEDIIWAYPIQDIALTFYDFRYYTDPALHSYDELCTWFRSGYEQVAPWPQEFGRQIDTLHVARQIWVANWVLINDEAIHHQPFINRLAERFRQFLDA